MTSASARFRAVRHGGALLSLFTLISGFVHANPAGGQVTAGSATITTTPGAVTVNQASTKAVIDWQSFSIGVGELTKFIQPSAASAVLNRVTGGQMSVINGTLSSNGRVYLLNGNGILIGPRGVVSTSAFTASTRDLSDADFESGDLHFTGSSNAGVTSLGQVSALGGDVIFIGKTVDNEGLISAPSGTVGLAAADDVLISQAGLEHVFVKASAGPSGAAGQTAVSNAGTIKANAAELRAANGNIYALAINNSGVVSATGVSTQGGRIWLVAEGNQGVTQNTGSLLAAGPNGLGGQIETSGGQVVAHGTVNPGKGGSWLIDPSDITIDAPTAATLVTSLNAGATVTEDSSLGTGGSGNITVSSTIVWTGTGTLDLFAYNNLVINAAITGNNGALAVKTGTGGSGTATPAAAISVGSFTLDSGAWVQNATTLPGNVLPAFTAGHFTVAGGSFLRTSGGAGTSGNPYQIVDAYGLEGIGTSASYLSASYLLTAAIDASGTSAWNAGAGFVPITNFTGTLVGNGQTVSGLTINAPAASNVGLFGSIGAGGSVSNLILTGASVKGLSNVGILAGSNAGTITTSNAAGSVSGTNSASSSNIGGLVGSNAGAISSDFSAATVTGYGDAGGLAGKNTGSITSSYSTGNTSSFLNGSTSGANIGGLVGLNSGGTVTLSYTTGSVNATDSTQVGGLVGSNASTATITEGYAQGSVVKGSAQVGGLVGANDATSTIIGSKVIDGVGNAGVSGTQDVGGLVGLNGGAVSNGSVLTAGAVLAKDGTGATTAVGGFVGSNSGAISTSFAQVVVGQSVGTTDATHVGGFAGTNAAGGTLTSIYSTGTVAGATDVGGLVGENDGSLGVQSTASGNVTGTTNVGGLVGYDTGTIGTQSYATGGVAGTTNVGGLIGENNTASAISGVYAQGNVSGSTDVGGLVGFNPSGNLGASSASGSVTGSVNGIGGLVGSNAATITQSSASGNVTAAAATNVGGLIGVNSGSVLSGSAGSHTGASGNVVGGTNVGGLVGSNSGTVGDGVAYVAALADYTSASGTVTGATNVGGLVGDNAGSVQQGSSAGAVSSSSTAGTAIGGLVGTNEASGTITVSFSGSAVEGNGSAGTNAGDTDSKVGGLVGQNLGGITKSNASGSVVGDSETGGLVGANLGASSSIQTSYSTGSVTGLDSTGGLVGFNQVGLVTQDYSTATVVGTTSVGGLVGSNKGAVSETYATGSVSGTNNVGGLVGSNTVTLGQSYATGAVTSAGTSGGLLGTNSGTVSNSYWDENSTGKGSTGIGSDALNTGATGLTSTSGTTAFQSTSYAGLGASSSVAGGASNAVQFTDATPKVAWYMLDGGTRPFLAWELPTNNPQVGGAYLVYTPHQLQLMAINLGANYTLGQAINLSETQSASGLWNTATGFIPVGTLGSPYTGSFSGGFGITNLYINNAALSYQGLFGDATGSLSAVTLSGSVTGLGHVGLLAGAAGGSISGASLSGSVTGQTDVGGAAGSLSGTLGSSAVSVVVRGNSSVGGIVGTSSGTLQDSYVTGSVTGTGASQSDLGGLIGSNSGTLRISYSIASVTGAATSTSVGGGVGSDTGTIDQSYATGTVSGGIGVGGLAGTVPGGGSILQSYATGAVSGAGQTGGLVGTLSGGGVARSYASGAVTGTDGATTGGLLGSVSAGSTYSNLFWDHANAAASVGNDLSVGQGPVTDLHALTINTSTASYAGLDASGTPGFTPGYGSSALIYASADSVWRAQVGSEYPLLGQLSTQVSGTAYSDAAHTTPAAGATLTFNSGSNTLATGTSNASGAFAFLFSADYALTNYLPSMNGTVRTSDSAANADSIAAELFNGNGVPSLLADIAQTDTWAQTVRAVSSGLSNSLLVKAGSTFVSNPANNPYGGVNAAVSENFDVGSTAGSYTLDGNITATGNVAFDSAGQVQAGFNHPVTLDAAQSAGNLHPTFTVNASLSSSAPNRALVVESDGNFVNNVGAGAFSTPSGSWIVYSQNPPGSGQSVEDQTNGLNQLHLYGTNYTQTPTYLLSPGQNYQVYSFTPTLTLTAVATGADGTGTLDLQYGTPTPALTYTASGLLPGDTITPGATFNQVLSNQPGVQTTYALYKPVGTYPVSFTGSTLPTSLIGYNLVFNSGQVVVAPNSGTLTLNVSGSQYFGYIGGGATYAYTYSGTASSVVAGDPNFNPLFSTTVGQFTNVNYAAGSVVPYANTISLIAASLSNYSNISITTVDGGFTVKPAAITVTGSGSSVYGEAIGSAFLTSSSPSATGTIYDSSGTGSTVNLTSLGYTNGSPAVTSSSHVGSYSFSVSGPSGSTVPDGSTVNDDLANYTITVNPGTYSITQRLLMITGTQNETHVYDNTTGPTTFGSTDYAVGALATGQGLVNGDKITGLMGRASSSAIDVGHYDYTVGTLGTSTSGGTATSDYNIVFSNAGFGLDITPLTITISALKGGSKVYGSSDPAFTLGNGYYGITTGALAAGDSFTGAGALGRQSGQNVNGGATYVFNSLGTIGITNGSSNTTGDYTITFSNPSNYGLVINPFAVTLTANNQSKTYGQTVTFAGTEFTLNATLPNSETIGSATLTSSGGAATAAVLGSPYTITPSAATGGTFNPANYTITYAAGTFTVNPAALTITANNQTKIYGQTYTFTGSEFTSSGLKNGETIGSVTLASPGAAAGANVSGSPYTIVPSAPTGGTFNTHNYSITYDDGSFTVNPATLTYTATPASQLYGNPNSTFTGTVTGFVNAQTQAGATSGTLAFTSTTGATTPVGGYAINGSGLTANNGNYVFVQAPANATALTISATPLTITPDNQSKTYGQTVAIPTNDFTSSGLQNGETIGSVTMTSPATAATAPVSGSPYTITATGASGGTFSATNYTITYDTALFTVDVAMLTIKANDLTKTYGSTYTFTGGEFTPSGLQNGETIGSVTLTSSGAAAGASVAGSPYSITPSAATGGTFNPANYSITYTNGSFTVNPATLTYTAIPATQIYGNPNSTFTGTLTGFVNGDTQLSATTGTAVYTSTTGPLTDVGHYAIDGSGVVSDTSNYVFAQAPANATALTINPATLTYTANPASRTYGAVNPALSGTITGFVNGQNQVSATTGTMTFTTSATATTMVGSYAVNGSGLTADHGDYTFVQAASNATDLVINQAPLTVTANNQSKIYGQTYTFAGTEFSSSGLQNGETIGSVTLTSGGAAAGASVAGSPYSITPSAATGGTFSSSNYSITYDAGTFVVNPATLTYTATPATQIYGNPNSTFTGTLTGFVNGDTQLSATTGTAVYTSTTGPLTDVGHYAIDGSGVVSDTSNYIFAQAPANATALTINPATLTYTANLASRTYGAVNPALSGTVTGFVNGQNQVSATTGTMTFTTSATATTVVGSYAVNGSGLTADHGDYTFVQAASNATDLVINQAPLTVTANNQSKIYGQTYTFAGTEFSSSGLQNGETIGSVTLNSAGAAAAANVSGSPYTITPSAATGGTFSLSNYAVTYDAGSFVVNPATLTYTATPATQLYGNPNSTFTGSVTGFVLGQSQATATSGTAAFTSATGATTGVGGYAITGSGLTANNGNYTFVQAPGNATALTINPAALILTADNQAKIYGQTYAFAGTEFTSSGLKNGETVGSVTLSSPGAAAAANVSGSPYTITPTAATGGTFNPANYAITYDTGTFTVSPATLTYTAIPAGQTYGTANSTFTGSVTGFVNGQTLATATTGTAAFTSATSAMTGVGAYAISGSGLTANNGNYTFVQAAGNASALTISQASLTVTADNESKTYGSAYAFTGAEFTSSGLQNGETIGSVTLASPGAAAAANVSGSPYAITPASATGGTFNPANYAITYDTGTLTVNPATLTFTATPAGQYYGNANSTFTGAVTGFVLGQTLATATSGTAAFTSATGATTGVGGYAITGSGLTANNGNYTFLQAPGNATALTINPAPLTLTADNQSKTYGQTYAFAGTEFTSSGLQNGETIGSVTLASLGAGAGANVSGSPYAITPSAATGGTFTAGNYAITYDAGTFTVHPATLTYASSTSSQTYGSSNTAFGGTVTGFVNGQTVATATTGTAAFTSTTTASSNVGTYGISGSGLTADNGNYVFVQSPGNTTALSITPATLTYTATAATQSYGISNTVFSGSVTGFVNGETLATATTGTPAFGSTTTATTTVGYYAINGSGLAANNGNYVFVQASGNATALLINNAPLTITANSLSKTYGQTYTFSGTEFSAVGLQNGQSIGSVVLSSPGAAASANVSGSPYTITISGATGGSFIPAEYVITYIPGTMTLNPATLTYAAVAASQIYGNPNAVFSGAVTGFANGDTLASATTGSLSFTSSTGASTNVGGYAITGAGLAANNGNYVFVQAPGNATALTINPATLVYTANPASRTYGAANPVLTGTVTGFVNGQGLGDATSGTASFGSAAGAASNVGSYAVTGSGLTANYGDYTFVQAPVNAAALAVTPAALTITAANQSKTYGQAANLGSSAFTSAGLQNGETVGSVTLQSAGSAALSPVSGSPYAISASAALGGTFNPANYTITYKPGSLAVNPAVLTITANPESKLDGLTFVFTGTQFVTSGLVGSDTVTQATLTSPGAAAGAPPGTYAISYVPGSATGTGISNYTIAFNTAPFVVNPSTLSLLPLPFAARAKVDQLLGSLFESGYGEKFFYQLEVPGTLSRKVLPDLAGIGTGSSIVDISIGLEDIYELDRFQSFRH